MRRALLTLSKLQLAATCPSAPVLPRIGSTGPKSDIGSALHEVNAARGEGQDVDLDEVADRWNLDGKDRAVFLARTRALELDIPEGAVYEVPLCLRADGSVGPAAGARGSYEVPDDALVAGTLDILFATPEPLADGRWCEPGSVLWTPDLKTGKDIYVAPIERNWQARVSALLGARWTQAECAVPAIVYPGPDGGAWDVRMRDGEAAPLRSEDLARIEQDVRALHERVAEQAAAVAEGKLPRLVTGAHCVYCPARAGCPAHVAEARALIEGRADLAAGELTASQAAQLAGRIGPARKVLENAEASLRAYVATHGPIPLPNGQVFGPVPGEKLAYHTRALYQAIVAELVPIVGMDAATRAADLAFGATKDGIYDAIRTAHEAAGLKKQMRAAFDRIVSRHTRSNGQESPEIVDVFEDGDVVRVVRGEHAEEMSPDAVVARWPVVLGRAAELVPTERWTAHYPKENTNQ